MTDLDTILEAVAEHLENCQTGSGHALAGDLPNVDNVLVGDYPTRDALKAALTVDWGGDVMPAKFGPGPEELNSDIMVRLYLSDIPNDDDLNKAARQFLSSSNGTKGLRPCLRAFRALGYMLAPLTARYLRPEERPEFRFSVGLEVRCTVKQFG